MKTPVARMTCILMAAILLCFDGPSPAAAGEGPMQRMYRLFRDFLPKSTSKVEEMNILARNEVDATAERIAFSTALAGFENNGKVGIAVYTFDTGKLIMLAPPGSGQIYTDPHFSDNDPDLLYLRHRDDQTPQLTTLKRCNVTNGVCEKVLVLEGSISDPVEVPGGLLFVHSPIDEEKLERFGFVDHDFYLLRDDGEIERLTNLEYYELNYVSVLTESIVFEAFGLSPKIQKELNILEAPSSSNKSNSRIYMLSHDGSVRRLQIDTSIVEPFAKIDASISTGPTVSPSMKIGSPLLAFKNGRSSDNGKYRYNLVVRNVETGEQDYVVAESFNMSAPTVVDGEKVIYFEYIDDSYSIRSYFPEKNFSKEFSLIEGANLRAFRN